MTSDQTTATDLLQDHVDAAEQLARLIAGSDDERFVVVFATLINQVEGFLARPGDEGRQLAKALLARTAKPHLASASTRRDAPVRERLADPDAPSVLTDRVYLQNARKLVRSRDRIIGGVPTSDFPDCVAVGATDRWCCTGTLVAPNVVVTAAHCLPRCARRIFLGEDVDVPGDGRVVQVRREVAHPGYNPPDPTDDIAVLILEEDITDVAPRAMADPDVLSAAFAVRLAGYGNTDPFSTGGYGRRRMVDAPIASADPQFGADPKREFVAGAPFLDRDSCNGDSGGPAYVDMAGEWFLAGATSRATASSLRPCGDGGIYTAVPVYADWIRSVEGGHW